MYKPNGIFKKAVEEKDLSAVKTCLVDIIKFDQTFKTKDFNEACEFVRENNVALIQEYKENVGERWEKDKTKWTSQYFFYLVENLRLNFAPEERIGHIKEVGEFVFGKDTLNSNGNVRSDRETTKQRERSNVRRVALVAIGIVAITIVGFYLIRK